MTTLNLHKLETLKSALRKRAAELARSLGNRHQIAIERSADAFDQTLLAAERESSAQGLEHEFRMLREVEAAWDRLHDGAFGICLSCQEPIAQKRLEAVPWAAYCVSCQAKEEESSAPMWRLAHAA
ncbi:MAG TPA: TraR/DksA family transcriptional regulator [Bryobacteraceae bacterium]|jgi:DnaK suppressor protein